MSDPVLVIEYRETSPLMARHPLATLTGIEMMLHLTAAGKVWRGCTKPQRALLDEICPPLAARLLTARELLADTCRRDRPRKDTTRERHHSHRQRPNRVRGPRPARSHHHRPPHGAGRDPQPRDRGSVRHARCHWLRLREGRCPVSEWLYIRSEPGLWTVGFYRPDGKWTPESDHGDKDEAAARVRWLNGARDDAATAEELRRQANVVQGWRENGDEPPDFRWFRDHLRARADELDSEGAR